MAIPAIAPPDRPEECELLDTDADDEDVAEPVGDVVGVAVMVKVFVAVAAKDAIEAEMPGGKDSPGSNI